MSVYLFLIVPNQFTDVRNLSASLAELNRIKQKLQNHYKISDRYKIEYEYETEPEYPSFHYMYEIDNISNADFWIHLHNGFIEIGFVKYAQYFLGDEGRSWARDHFFDIVFALGEKQAFVASEFHYHNYCYGSGVGYGDPEFDFEYWRKEFPNTQDFDASWMITEDFSLIPDDDSVFLDRFEDCWERLDVLRRRFPDCEILGISEVNEWYIPVLKEGKFNLIHKETGMEMPCDDVEAAFWPALS